VRLRGKWPRSPIETVTAREIHRSFPAASAIVRIGRATYQPGWKWSEHVGTGPDDRCQVEHLGLVVSGRAAVVGPDYDRVMEPGDIFAVPPDHDSWVVGDEPYVSLHFLGADEYATKG
jgi:hypothetical protein